MRCSEVEFVAGGGAEGRGLQLSNDTEPKITVVGKCSPGSLLLPRPSFPSVT